MFSHFAKVAPKLPQPIPINIANGGIETSSSASDYESASMKKVLSTHSPRGHEVDVKPILPVIKDLLRQANLSMDSVINGSARDKADGFVEKTAVAGFAGMLEDASIINKISCELSCKCSGEDAHSATMTILDNLSSYSWDAKVVISLAAFAVIYGEFWLIAQLSTTNPIAKSVCLLKRLSVDASSLKSRIDPMNNLLNNAVLKVIDCIFQFQDLPPQYISHEKPPAPLATAMAQYPAAAYWTIRSIVACSSQITSLLGMSKKQIAPTEALELSSLAEKLVNIQHYLDLLLQHCQEYIAENKNYKHLRDLFGMGHVTEDNMKILKELIKDDKQQQPLLGPSKQRVGIEVLKGKTVVFLISDLDKNLEAEITTLKQTYSEKTQSHQYEIVWIPVIDGPTGHWDESHREEFKKLQAKMPWHIIAEPWSLDPAFIRYIKEDWHFSKKLILVVLDPQGKVVCDNAIHMFMIWRNGAYPFHTAAEGSLWKQQTWKLELLLDGIDQTMVKWISEGKHIFLYGGVDLEKTKEVTKAAKDLAKDAGIALEMVYVGQSTPKKGEKDITKAISDRVIPGTYLPNPTYFWTRLHSMCNSGTQHVKTSEKIEGILQEVSAMLSFDGSDQGWAVISKGSTEMIRAKGDSILETFKELSSKPEEIKAHGFMTAVKKKIQKWRQDHQAHHCNKISLPWTSTGVPVTLLCADCGRPMEKYFLYRCCTD